VWGWGGVRGCVWGGMGVWGGGWGEQVQHALKQAGAETIMSGKWHLNTEERDAAWDYADTVAKAGLTGFTQVPSMYQSDLDLNCPPMCVVWC